MKTIFNIARVELQQLFFSPMAWVVITMFAVQLGLSFCTPFLGYATSQELGNELPWGLTSMFFNSPTQGLFGTASRYLFLYIPLITMGLMSREISSGAIKLLYSSPVSNIQIILGKFLSMMIMGLALMSVIIMYVIFGVVNITSADIPLMLSGLLGVYLIICTYSAIGLFMSSLTSYQIVSAMLTFATLSFLSFVNSWGQEHDIIRDITWWLSINGRGETFLFGLICSEDLIYFLVVISVFLSFTYIKLYNSRFKSSWYVTFGKYVGVVLVAIVIGYVTSLPKMRIFADVTETKINTLTESSQDIMSKLDGDLTITTYVNLLHKAYHAGAPKNRKRDINRFKRYTRFKPEIKFEYVYYYADAKCPTLEQMYPNSTMEFKVKKLTNSYSLDSTSFLSPEQVGKIIDLSGEEYRFIRHIKSENGKEAFLRIYDDPAAFPYEAEISAALKRIVMEDLPSVGFLVSHGERSSVREGERDYNRFSWDLQYRYSLINNGFDIDEVTLAEELPEGLDILVISDMKSPLTEQELINYKKFVAKGGNILIAGAPTRQDNMNPLIADLGVQFMPGQLVQISDHHDPNLICANLSKESGDLTYIHKYLYDNPGYSLTMPACVGINYTEDKGFKVTPVLTSKSSNSWNELQTTRFIDEKTTLDKELGEIEKSNFTGIALTRDINNKEQKIFIMGDSDCITNIELARTRAGIKAMNQTFIKSTFFWLSDRQVPIDGRRPDGTDNGIWIGEDMMKVFTFIFTWGIPAILLIVSLFLWVRRRNR